MSKYTLKFFKKALAMFLSILIIISVMPMPYAQTKGSSESVKNNAPNGAVSETTSNVSLIAGNSKIVITFDDYIDNLKYSETELSSLSDSQKTALVKKMLAASEIAAELSSANITLNGKSITIEIGDILKSYVSQKYGNNQNSGYKRVNLGKIDLSMITSENSGSYLLGKTYFVRAAGVYSNNTFDYTKATFEIAELSGSGDNTEKYVSVLLNSGGTVTKNQYYVEKGESIKIKAEANYGSYLKAVYTNDIELSKNYIIKNGDTYYIAVNNILSDMNVRLEFSSDAGNLIISDSNINISNQYGNLKPGDIKYFKLSSNVYQSFDVYANGEKLEKTTFSGDSDYYKIPDANGDVVLTFQNIVYKTVTVKYYGNGNLLGSQTVKVGSYITPDKDLLESSSSLSLSWSKSQDGNDPYDFTVPLTEDISLYKYTKTGSRAVRVYYYFKNLKTNKYELGDIRSQVYASTQSSFSAEIRTYEGYQYNADYTAKPENEEGYIEGKNYPISGTFPPYSESYSIVHSINLYYDPITTDPFKLTIVKPDGTSELKNYYINENISSLSGSAPQKHTFDGYYTDSSYTERYNLVLMPGKDLTIYEKWIFNAVEGDDYSITSSDEGIVLKGLNGCKVSLDGTNWIDSIVYSEKDTYSNQIIFVKSSSSVSSNAITLSTFEVTESTEPEVSFEFTDGLDGSAFVYDKELTVYLSNYSSADIKITEKDLSTNNTKVVTDTYTDASSVKIRRLTSATTAYSVKVDVTVDDKTFTKTYFVNKSIPTVTIDKSAIGTYIKENSINLPITVLDSTENSRSNVSSRVEIYVDGVLKQPVNNQWTTVSAGEYTANVNVSSDGIHNVKVYYANSGNYYVYDSATVSIDATAPSDLTLDFSTSIVDKVLSTLSFGFYKDKATLSVSAVDKISGIDKFVIKEVSETDLTNVLNEYTIQNSSISSNNNVYSATLDLTNESRGKYILIAKDKSGNESQLIGGKVIVIDSTTPKISLTTDEITGGVKVKVAIDEANFFVEKSDEVNLLINRVYTDDGINIIKSEDIYKSLVLSKNASTGLYEGSVTFTETGKYEISAEYTDYSGNKGELLTGKITFSIDSEAPQLIKVDYGTPVEFNGKNYYKDSTTINVVLRDLISGVKKVDWKIVSGEKVLLNGTINTFETDTSNPSGNDMVAKINLTNEIKGTLIITPFDDKGNFFENTCKEIIIDKTAPIFKLSFNKNAYINNYYVDAVVPTVTLTEENYDSTYSEKAIVELWGNTADNSYAGFVKLDAIPIETAVTNGVNFKFPTISVDGSYKIKASYTDISGNPVTFESEVFVVDSKAPVINVAYDENGASLIYNKNINATITVTERNFDPSKFVFTVSKTNLLGSLSYDEISNYLKTPSNWTKVNEDTHRITIGFSEGIYENIVYSVTDVVSKTSGETNYSGITNDKFTVDITKPEILGVEYKPTFGSSILPVKITATLNDYVTGIEKIIISYYDKNNTVVDTEVLNRDDLKFSTDGVTVDLQHQINKEFKGYIGFVVYDHAGNSAEYLDKNIEVVIENDKPVIDVYYNDTLIDQNNSLNNNKKYYNDQKVEIIIQEDNFDANDVKINLDKKPGLNGTFENVNVTWSFTKGDDGKYHAVTTLTENGIYKLNVEYTDKSGNIAEPFENTFIISKPNQILLNGSYNNDNVKNGLYFNNDRTLTLTLKDVSPNFNNFTASVTKDGNDISDTINSILRNPDNWTASSNGEVYTLSYTFTQGEYVINSISYSVNLESINVVYNSENKATTEFVIDKDKPTDVTISYSEALNNSIIDTILGVISFGFYNAPVTVTFTAKDALSGVNSFEYFYTKQSGASSTNISELNDVVSATYDSENDLYYAEIKLPADEAAQLRGNIRVLAYDKADNFTGYTDDKVIVVDNKKPIITLGYDNNSALNGKYYSDKRVATITVNEANFFEGDSISGVKIEDLKFVVKKNNVDLGVTLGYTKTSDDVYTASYSFDESGIYSVEISYTDKSGNSIENTIKEEFIIDLENPVVRVSYDNNKATNGKYFTSDRTAIIKVEEENFSPENFEFTFEAVNVAGEDVSTFDYTAYLKDETSWVKVSDGYQAQITFDTEAQYDYVISCKDLSGRTSDGIKFSSETVAGQNFVIDNTAPSDLKIEYSKSILDIVLESLSFGFYKSSVTVTMTATDLTAGMDRIEWYYKKQLNASITNVSEVNKTETQFTSIDNKTISLEIVLDANDGQYRGKIGFIAYDKAGNSSSLNDEKVIVVDNKAPVVTVSYDNNESYDNLYYVAPRTATIQINEANFYASDVVITVGKRTGADEDFVITNPTPEFTKNGDVYTAQITFNENADYTFDISYTDKSGNVYDSYIMDEFTIDMANASIEVTYDNNNAVNGKYFSENRIATIIIDKRNFNARRISAEITHENSKGEDIDTQNIASKLRQSSSWTRITGTNKYRANVLFTEGVYTFKIGYSDYKGATDYNVDYGTSVAPNDFVIDHTNPTNLQVTYSKSVIDTIIEGLSFGFYKSGVDVTVSADDSFSGINSLVATYERQSDASATNAEKKTFTFDNSQIVYSENGARAQATFELSADEAQYRGSISFEATDRVGNKNTYTDDKVVVVDDVTPYVDVAYDNNNVTNGKYYSADRIVTIKINEANFFEGNKDGEGNIINDVKFTVGKKNFRDDSYTEENVTPQFVKNGDEYTATIKFDTDGWYTFDISYTDKSGNIYDSYVKDEFVIDKTIPQIEVSYDNNNTHNEKYFDSYRTLNVAVTEENFDATRFVATITNKDVSGNVIKDSAYYTEYFKKADSWSYVDGKYVANIELTDGRYLVDFAYTDYSNFVNNGIDSGNSAVPFDFVVDTKAPTDLKVEYSKSVLDTILESLSFGFYKANVVMTLEATDITAGIDYLEWTYNKQVGASSSNSNDVTKTILSKDLTYSADKKTVNAEVTLSSEEAQYRGKFNFTAYDNSGNSSSTSEDKIIVVDNKAPDVVVEYDNNNSFNGNYYNADRTATITINEANFFEGQDENGSKVRDVKITVGKRAGNEKDYTYTEITPEFIKNGDLYTAEINFTEDADYSFYIEYTDKSGNAFKSYKTDYFTIDKTAPEIEIVYDNNNVIGEKYFNADRTATIIVIDRSFNAADFNFNVEKTDLKKKAIGNTDYLAYLKNDANWTHENGVHTAKVLFENGHYKLNVSYSDLSGNQSKNIVFTGKATTDFVIDKVVPTDLNISYSKSVVDIILETISFGFYKSEVKVTITANDDIAGVDHFVWKYNKQNGVSDTNQDYETAVIEEENITYTDGGRTATAEFTLSADKAQYRGKISFEVYDRAENMSNINSDKVVVVDDIAPGIKISYDNNSVSNDYYYNADRTATISIDEANFFENVTDGNGDIINDVKVVVGKTYNDGTYIEEYPALTYQKSDDTYVSNINFNENADYTLKITYTDKSGNESSYKIDEAYTLDKIQPVINLSYDNNDLRNEKYFASDRTAEITVTEHNFDPKDFNIIVEAVDGMKLPVEIPDYDAFVKDRANWTSNGDVHKTKITFTNEAEYNLDLSYTDLANNKAEGVNVGSSKAALNFILDKTKPQVSVSYDNNKTHNENHFDAYRTLTLVVTEQNFDSNNIEVTITRKDVTGKDLTDKEYYSNYFKNPNSWTYRDGKYYSTITFEDGRYFVDFKYHDFSGWDNEGVVIVASEAPFNFVVDTKNPTDLKVEYSKSVLDTILETLSFGFYKADVTITLEAEDIIAGIDYIEWTYNKQQGTSDKNASDIKRVILSESIEYSADQKTAKATFKLSSEEAQYRGNISFTAYDNSGNYSSISEDKVVVVDNKAPDVVVEYDNNNSKNGNYYNADRTATITINEANFFEGQDENGSKVRDVKITVGKRVGNEKDYTFTEITPKFTKNGDIYTAEVSFTEDADYSFYIEYTDKSGNEFKSYKTDYFTIDKTAPKIEVSYDNNNVIAEKYFDENRTATITVTDRSFRASDFNINVSTTDIKGNEIGTTDYLNYLKNDENWTHKDGVHTARIIFKNGHYNISMDYTDLAGNINNEIIYKGKAVTSFVVDKVAPTDLKISYSKSVLDIILETISFGFYQSEVKVTIVASDDVAGVDHFVWNYKKQADASDINQNKQSQTINSADIKYTDGGRVATTEFTLSAKEAQYRGKISFEAYDRAKNMSYLSDDKVVVVDNKAPGVKVTYDNDSAENNLYYKADRVATISIDEANFFENSKDSAGNVVRDVNITVGKTTNDGKYSEERLKCEYEKNGDIYTTKVKFNEDADYVLKIDYTDKSGNKITKFEDHIFTVDKTKPIVKVSFNNNDLRNGKYFASDRTAEITITEHNFDPKDINVNVTAVDGNGKQVSISDYQSMLQKPSAWTSNGDVHKAKISFTKEAEYNFSVSYKDLAGNKSATMDTGSSKAPTNFVIDKTAPSASITVGNWSASKNGTTWNKVLTSISYSLYSQNALTVSVSSNDTLSRVEKVEYFLSENIVSKDALEDKKDGWKDYSKFTVQPDRQFIVYVKVTDKSGNVYYASSDGIIIDNTNPKVSDMIPYIYAETEVKKDIYTDDVKVKVNVIDPKTNNNVYTGLKNVYYDVFNLGEKTQEGTLYSYNKSESSKSDLKQSFSTTITVKAENNNSNNVIVNFYATDNAGNDVKASLALMIDITDPAIRVSYDNNNDDGIFPGYFNANRTATIYITERNFSADKVKFDITNTEGVIPSISNWTVQNGSGNGDNTVHSATITYSDDGDYKFNISCEDKCGNKSGNVDYMNSVSPKEFTIDKTNPKISVSYDNNNAEKQNYYKADRTATITINEHNFDASRVNVGLTSTGTKPTISAWSNNGDSHTATIRFVEDATYSLTVSYIDMAGNEAESYKKDEFHIDKTAPTLSISGVKDKSANKGDVIPVISYSDKNIGESNINIDLVGSYRGKVEVTGSMSGVDGKYTFTMSDFEHIKEVDDIYTLTVTVSDYAGNKTTKSIVFSINRFGSNYSFNETTQEVNGSFVSSLDDIVMYETNVNELDSISITIFKDNDRMVLQRDMDYTVEVVRDNGNWYKYKYVIKASCFEEDGVYHVVAYSVDKANNKSENTKEAKNADLSFIVDKTKPRVILTNLENNQIYSVENKTVNLNATDNIKLESLIVYLDGKEVASWVADEIEKIISKGESFSFDIKSDSGSAHELKVVACDKAGNITEKEINRFFVTTNLWARFVNNNFLFYGTLSLLGLIILLFIIFLIVKNKKKEDDEVSKKANKK